MKKIAFLLFAAAGLSLSCSSDDDASNTPGPVPSDNVFLPLENADYWVYNVNGSLQSGRDSLYVANDTVIGTHTYKKIKAKDYPVGFFSNTLNNNGVRKDGDMLLLSGSASVAVSDDFPFSISITDFALFKENANAGDVLGTVTGSTVQQYNGISFRLDYVLTTTAKPDVASLTVNMENYTNVKQVETKINLKIVLNDLPDVVLLAAQDVVVSQQYYALNTGLIKAESQLSYNVNEQLATTLGIPAAANETQQEIITDYSVE